MKFYSDEEVEIPNFLFCADNKRKANFPYTHKLWGGEQLLVNNPLYCAKLLWVNSGYQCSLHRHHVKDETFIISRGDITLELGDKIIKMERGDRVHVPTGTWHRFRNEKHNAVPAVILEVSTHHDDADVERKEESRAV